MYILFDIILSVPTLCCYGHCGKGENKLKNVLITGGSRGIGREMVRLFAERGYSVAFTYKSSVTEAGELALETGALAICADSENASDIERAVTLAKAHMGGIDCLINNAGIAAFSLFTDIALEEWQRVINVDLTSAFLYSKLVIPDMINKKQGRIINVTSIWGLVGSSCEVHYSTAKAGLIGFTKALAKELGPSGITVNAIAPGVIDTDMNSVLDANTLHELADETPLSRIGTPREVAEVALFLAGDSASFITGDVLNVSGGFVV